MYRVLIVDDEPMICQALAKVIRQAGHIETEVRCADNGRSALDMFAEFQPDFLFTDIRMPKMDGLELCRNVSERFPDVRMVVVSGYGEFEYAKKCITYGVDDYLLKPINRTKVHEVLDKLLAKAREKRQSANLSLARIEIWLKRIEDAVWMLREDLLEPCLRDLEQEIASAVPQRRQRELYGDLVELLSRHLAARGAELAMETREIRTFADFRQAIGRMVAQLRDIRKGKIKDPVEEAKNYIEKNLGKEVSLEDVANMLGLNPSYFSQLFKLRTNETFVQYRIRRRMEMAKRLLEIPHYRITDISYEIGYADHPHFTKTFKRYMGVSPAEYRRMLGIE